ncbi:MAG: magnesium/cobalt transporter CorA [Ekhidna sp.]|uniref:magnesium/cobalt transporter CorA n=1 Tax=Ekhidna sp. TaxID=2608089 RepID=UPI003298E219
MKKQFDITQIDLTRPDKLLLSGLFGLKSLVTLPLDLYSSQKKEAKTKGEITFIGTKKVEEVQTQLYEFNSEGSKSSLNPQTFDFLKTRKESKVYWLNFHGLHEVDWIQDIGETLNLDRITVRQILDTTLRPKVEEYEHYLFFSVKSILKDNDGNLQIEQMSFILGDNYVISFQEQLGDYFDHIRNKITEKLGLVRKKPAEFLLYQLLDANLDNYFEIIEQINQEVKLLENIILTNPTQDSLVKLEQMKQTTEMIKKSHNPFKDSLRVIANRKTPFISKQNNTYFHELMNSCNSVIEEIESTTHSLESLTNIYFSSLSQKMNETMKVLTTVATVFIPLTFIAGIYGMNFEYMPELKYRNGYFVIWGIMGLVFIGSLIYFKRRKWL